VFGRDPYFRLNQGFVVFIGIQMCIALSLAYGLLFGLVASRIAARSRSPLFLGAFGALYGLAVWFMNYRLIAPGAYPWFLREPQRLEVFLHVFLFGLPLGLYFAGALSTEARHASHPEPTMT
jgi:hypothetical protein